MRTHRKFSISFTEALKKKLLGWAQQFGEVIWLDSNQYQQNHSSFQAILAVDAFTAIKTDSYEAFKKLEEYQNTTKDWLFGYLTYDLKNDVERLKSQNFDGLHFQNCIFFSLKSCFYFLIQK